MTGENITQLITGFEPFTTGQGLVLDHNPTAQIAAQVASRLPLGDHRTLPVSYEKTKAALGGAFQELRPRHWIGLGYAPHRTTLDFETIALNMEHAVRGDNDGETPWMRPIVNPGPQAYKTRIEVKEALEILNRHGAPAVAAFHAGTFLCNQVFFLGCHEVESPSPLEKAAFIHVPPMDTYEPLVEGLVALFNALETQPIG